MSLYALYLTQEGDLRGGGYPVAKNSKLPPTVKSESLAGILG